MSSAHAELPDRSSARRDVALLAACAVVLTALWFIGSGKEFWYSERFVQVLGSQSWGEMFRLLRVENNPPLFFVVARVWETVSGPSERALRTLPLLFGVAFVCIMWIATNRIAGRRAARYAAVVASISGFVVLQSSEYRMYTLLLSVAASALGLTWSYAESRRVRTLCALMAVHVIGFYTHYTYIPLGLFLVGWLLYACRTEWRRITVAVLMVISLCAPWFAYSLLPIVRDLDKALDIQRHSGASWESLIMPFRIVAPAVFQETRTLFAVRFIASVAVGIAIVIALRSLLRADGRRKRILTLLAGSSLCMLVVFTAARLTAPKYASVSVPALLMLVGIGLSTLDAWRRLGRLVAAAVVVVSASVSIVVVRMPYVTYAEAARIVENAEGAGDRMLVFPFNDEIAVRPYYHGALDVKGFFPLKAPGTATLADNVQYNFRSTLDARTVDMLAQYVGSSPHIWFFYDVSLSDGFWRTALIDGWFTSRGYSRTVYKDAFHNVPPLLVRYDVAR